MGGSYTLQVRPGRRLASGRACLIEFSCTALFFCVHIDTPSALRLPAIKCRTTCASARRRWRLGAPRRAERCRAMKGDEDAMNGRRERCLRDADDDTGTLVMAVRLHACNPKAPVLVGTGHSGRGQMLHAPPLKCCKQTGHAKQGAHGWAFQRR